MSFDIKPGANTTLNVAGTTPTQIQVAKLEISRRLEALTPVIQSITVYNRTKTAKITVIYEPAHIRIEVTNEEEDSRFQVRSYEETPEKSIP